MPHVFGTLAEVHEPPPKLGDGDGGEKQDVLGLFEEFQEPLDPRLPPVEN